LHAPGGVQIQSRGRVPVRPVLAHSKRPLDGSVVKEPFTSR
jgi:hypothetical protein